MYILYIMDTINILHTIILSTLYSAPIIICTDYTLHHNVIYRTFTSTADTPNNNQLINNKLRKNDKLNFEEKVFQNTSHDFISY